MTATPVPLETVRKRCCDSLRMTSTAKGETPVARVNQGDTVTGHGSKRKFLMLRSPTASDSIL